jgi:Rod binding domain-containing protein
MADLPTSFVSAQSAIGNGTVPSVPKTKDPAAIEKAAQDFEAVFLSQMLETMFAGVQTDGPFGGGPSEGIFRSLMVQEYGKVLANNGGIGLSDAIKRDMLRMQEVNAK